MGTTLGNLAHLAPALVIYIMTPLALDGMAETISFIRGATQIYMIVVLMLVSSINSSRALSG